MYVTHLPYKRGWNYQPSPEDSRSDMSWSLTGFCKLFFSKWIFWMSLEVTLKGVLKEKVQLCVACVCVAGCVLLKCVGRKLLSW